MSEIAYVKIDTNQLTETKEELNQYIQDIVSMKESIEASVRNLKNHFHGEPAEVFYLVVTADLKELEDALLNLKLLLQYENRAIENYEKCEMVVSGIVGDMV